MTLVKRNKRVALHLPVEVRGEDVSGTRFTELTHSVNISGGGILFESHRQIPIGARLACASSSRSCFATISAIATRTRPGRSCAAWSSSRDARRGASVRGS